MDFETTQTYVKTQVAQRVLAHIQYHSIDDRLKEAMIYATQGNGKYIRSFLVYAFAIQPYEKSEISPSLKDSLFSVCAALEMIHSYSLAHDDLPAMDNATLRRGRPSCWAAFDEATAILVGDALLTLAFDVLSSLPSIEANIKLELVRLFAAASGPQGMVAGQMMDLYPPENASFDQIHQMQSLKTGALFGLACEAGILLKGEIPAQRALARSFGQRLGLLFQITDDLLDCFGNQEQEGKTLQNDQNKTTFMTLLGMNGIEQQMKMLHHALLQNLSEIGNNESPLHHLIDFLLNRVTGFSPTRTSS